MPHSIVIADPSTVALGPAPIEPGWILEGRPQANAKELARSGDGTSGVSCTAVRFHWHYSVDEAVHIISGEVFATNENCVERRLGPGDMAFFPAGSRSTWRFPRRCASSPCAVMHCRSPWDSRCGRGESCSPSLPGSAARSSWRRGEAPVFYPSAGNHS